MKKKNKYIITYYDRLSSEAKVLFHESKYSFQCYSFSFDGLNYCEGKIILFAFGSKNIMISSSTSFSFYKTSESAFSYHVCGKKAGERLVSTNSFLLELDEPIPKDILVGQMVEFDCLRIDVD